MEKTSIKYLRGIDQFQKKDILQLKSIEEKIRIEFDIPPKNIENLKILNEEVLSYKPNTSIVLTSDNLPWIDLNLFKELSLIQSIDFMTRPLSRLDNIEGISHFKKLKTLGILLASDKDLDISELSELPCIEELVIEEPLNKKRSLVIGSLQTLKSLKIRKLDLNFIQQPLIKLTTLEVFNLKSADNFASIFPNIEVLDIYSSNYLENIDFVKNLSSLKRLFIWGANNIKEIPDLSNLKNLEQLHLRNMKRVEYIPNLSYVQKLSLEKVGK